MKTLLVISLTVMFSAFAFASDFYSQEVQMNNGKKVKLDQYKGKSVLVVNIATQCGYTGQLKGLEKIYKEFKGKDFVVLGVPSNEFGGQTPESDAGVKKFCELNYGVTFPLTKKMLVKGDDKSSLYKYLVGSTDNKEIGWNFTKFLIDKKGKLVKRYNSGVSPDSDELLKDIKASL